MTPFIPKPKRKFPPDSTQGVQPRVAPAETPTAAPEGPGSSPGRGSLTLWPFVIGRITNPDVRREAFLYELRRALQHSEKDIDKLLCATHQGVRCSIVITVEPYERGGR